MPWEAWVELQEMIFFMQNACDLCMERGQGPPPFRFKAVSVGQES